MRILLVEDDEAISFLYKRVLDKAGHATDAALTGSDGFEKVAANKYDLILLDVMLPDMNGLEILKRLKANDSTRKIPVIMLSNLGQDTVMQEAFQLGAKQYLIKAAYEPQELVTKIMSILSEESKVTSEPSVPTPAMNPALDPQGSPAAVPTPSASVPNTTADLVQSSTPSSDPAENKI